MHIVFDFDGTLADSTALVRENFDELSRKYAKHPVTFRDLYDGGIMHLIKKSGVSMLRVPHIGFELKRLMRTMLDDVQLVPGFLPVLKEVSKKHKLAIVSSNSEDNIMAFLRRHKIEPYFDFVYSDSSLFGKDLILLRLKKKHRVTEMIYVGDENRDVTAAKHAKVPIIAVTWGYNSRKLLTAADHIIDRPDQLPLLLPAYTRQPYHRT